MMWMKTKKVSKKYEEVWEGVKKEIEKRLIVAKKLNVGKIFKKLGLNLMTICHQINLKNYAY